MNTQEYILNRIVATNRAYLALNGKDDPIPDESEDCAPEEKYPTQDE